MAVSQSYYTRPTNPQNVSPVYFPDTTGEGQGSSPPYVDPNTQIAGPLPPGPATPMDGGNGGQGTASTTSNTVPTPTVPPPTTTAPAPAPAPTPAAAPTANSSIPSESAVDAIYEADLGRPVSDAEYQQYWDTPNVPANWQETIFDSPEAQAFRTKSTAAPTSPTPTATAAITPNNSPLGNSVDTGIESLIGSQGMTPQESSLLSTVNGIIAGGGALPGDNSIEQQQIEQARENESNAETSQLNDAYDELANRGLVSEPGVPQGQTGSAINQIERTIAPQYAQSVQAIQTNQQQLQESRLQSAISTATGLDTNAASNLLTALGTGNSRQLGLAQIALDSLSQDQSWNEFLANYGLNRDQVLASIQSGNVSALMTLLNLFESTANTSASGHV